MKKIIVMLLAIMFVVGIFAATAPSAYAAEVPTEAATTNDITLTVQTPDGGADTLVQQIVDTAMRLAALVILLLATRYVLPWMKEKGLYSTIQKFVQAAEKLAETGVIAKTDKKEWVWALLERTGVKRTEKTDAMIESAVKELDWMGEELALGIMGDGDGREEATE